MVFGPAQSQRCLNSFAPQSRWVQNIVGKGWAFASGLGVWSATKATSSVDGDLSIYRQYLCFVRRESALLHAFQAISYARFDCGYSHKDRVNQATRTRRLQFTTDSQVKLFQDMASKLSNEVLLLILNKVSVPPELQALSILIFPCLAIQSRPTLAVASIKTFLSPISINSL
jgi:hypothetical protein